MGYLAVLQSLKRLSLEFTRVTEAGLIYLLALPVLDDIVIDMQKIDVVPLLNAGGSRFFRKETHLDLIGQGLDDSQINFVTDCKKLSLLMLNKNNITGPGLAGLRGLRHLVQLWIEDNPFNSTAVENILALRHLKELTVRGTGISSEDIEKLKQAFPRARLFTDEGDFL